MDWWKALLAAVAVLCLALTACSDSSEESSTTSTAIEDTSSSAPGGSTTSSPTTPTTSAGSGGTTTTTASAAELPEYSIESRTAGQGGDTVVVLLPVGTYSDLDLENVVVDVVERFAPIVTVHVVDDPAAIPLVLRAPVELTAAERQLIDEHYFVRLEEGFRLIYQGPFAAAGQVILGS